MGTHEEGRTPIPQDVLHYCLYCLFARLKLCVIQKEEVPGVLGMVRSLKDRIPAEMVTVLGGRGVHELSSRQVKGEGASPSISYIHKMNTSFCIQTHS